MEDDAPLNDDMALLLCWLEQVGEWAESCVPVTWRTFRPVPRPFWTPLAVLRLQVFLDTVTRHAIRAFLTLNASASVTISDDSASAPGGVRGEQGSGLDVVEATHRATTIDDDARPPREGIASSAGVLSVDLQTEAGKAWSALLRSEEGNFFFARLFRRLRTVCTGRWLTPMDHCLGLRDGALFRQSPFLEIEVKGDGNCLFTSLRLAIEVRAAIQWARWCLRAGLRRTRNLWVPCIDGFQEFYVNEGLLFRVACVEWFGLHLSEPLLEDTPDFMTRGEALDSEREQSPEETAPSRPEDDTPANKLIRAFVKARFRFLHLQSMMQPSVWGTSQEIMAFNGWSGFPVVVMEQYLSNRRLNVCLEAHSSSSSSSSSTVRAADATSLPPPLKLRARLDQQLDRGFQLFQYIARQCEAQMRIPISDHASTALSPPAPSSSCESSIPSAAVSVAVADSEQGSSHNLFDPDLPLQILYRGMVDRVSNEARGHYSCWITREQAACLSHAFGPEWSRSARLMGIAHGT